MPDDAQLSLQGLLSKLEELQNSPDSALYTNKSHLSILKSINTVLSSDDELTSEDADRVLNLCSHYKKDLTCVTYLTTIISRLINIDEIKTFSPPLDFVQSALTVLDFVKICNVPEALCQRMLAIQVFMSHPTHALTDLIKVHSHEVINTLTICLTNFNPKTSNIKPFVFLKLLAILPDDEKAMFVKEGIPLWLTHIIPMLVRYLTASEDTAEHEECLQYLEMLVQELILQDYTHYPEWQTMLKNICDHKSFPLCIKTLMEKGKDSWHRIWIVIIKLLKSYVTRIYGTFGTPINSMLPIVETAFKRDSAQRVRAFKCWNELIDNFSNETNENCLQKRVKLLMIPLRLNNTKTEEIAIAKLQTWWHLVLKFKPKLERFINEILIPFLHFIFGRNPASSKPEFWAGQLSNIMLRKKCLEVFVEIVGHSDCTSMCVNSMPVLDGGILDVTILINHWTHWYYALKVAIKVAAMIYSPDAKANIQCVWKSLLLLITELPNNNIRKDLFNELVKLLADLSQDCCLYGDLEDILIDDLMLPLFRDSRLKSLLLTRSKEHRPMHKIVTLITASPLDKHYERFSSKDFMTELKPIATALMTEAVHPSYTTWFLEDLPKTDVSLKIWTSLVEAFRESAREHCLTALKNVLKWPFQSLHTFCDVKQPALSWYTLYSAVHSKRSAVKFHDDILQVLPDVSGDMAVNYFTMFAYIAVLKYKLLGLDDMKKLESLTSQMTDYMDFEEVIPPLVDALGVLLDHVTTSVDENLTQVTINCVLNVLRVMILERKTASIAETTEVNTYDKSVLLGSLLRSLTPLFKVNAYTAITTKVLNELKEHIPSLNQGTVSYAAIISSTKMYLSNCSNESVKTEIRCVIALLEKSNETEIFSKEFTSPKAKQVRKSKKKELSIVDTTVENGEEYVVVKSNWKFNPKNLTENQKEKLMRKSDIPALYQDLSQSQDEFKQSTWKTDSQDTSISSCKSSKSSSDKEASEILKNMPSTDIVPKIMENILTDNDKNTNVPDTVKSPVSIDKLAIMEKIVTPKGKKTPRMALKDRVFRNVRNLIEKSSHQNEGKNNNNDNIIPQVDNVPKIPYKRDIEVSKSPVSLSKVNNTVVYSDTLENQNLTDTSNTPAIKKKSDNTVISAKKVVNSADVDATPNSTMKRDTVAYVDKYICNTPVTNQKQIKETNITNSAPSLSVERPARTKRIPKKFDDSELFALKKRRYSRSDSQFSAQNDNQPEVTVAQIHTTKDKNDCDLSQNVVLLNSAINKENDADDSQKMDTAVDGIVICEKVVTCHGVGNKDIVAPQIPEVVGEVVMELNSNKAPKTSQETTILSDEGAKPIDKTQLDLDISNETKKGNVNSVSVTTPLNETKSMTALKSVQNQICYQIESAKNQEIIETSTAQLPVSEVVNNELEHCTTNDVQNYNVMCTEVVSKAVDTSITTLSVKSTKIKPAKRPLVVVEKLKIASPDLIQNYKAACKPDNLPSEIECLDRKKSPLKATIGQNESNNEQLDIQSTPKNNKNHQKPLSKESLVQSDTDIEKSVNLVADVNKSESSGEKKVNNVICKNVEHLNVVTPLNKTKNVSQQSSVKKKAVENEIKEKQEISVKSTPKYKVKSGMEKSPVKNNSKTSRIVKKLMIDMVQGHPLLTVQSEKRVTRNKLTEIENSRRKSLGGKLQKSKLDATPKRTKRPKDKKVSLSNCVIVEETQGKKSNTPRDVITEEAYSEDFIESSQDSNITTVSVKSTRKTPTRPSVIANETLGINETRGLIQINTILPDKSEEDISFPHNKTAEIDNVTDPTFNMDTEPMDDDNHSNDFSILDEPKPTPVKSETMIGFVTQELADADTQRCSPVDYMDLEVPETATEANAEDKDITQSLPDVSLMLPNMDNTNEVTSPFKDADQRKQDFLNNTLEISPIKIQSPDRAKKFPQPETSSDYVVIKLTSPVHINGEPFEKSDSPEFFTQDKISPDKRDASPPRAETSVNTSSSSSLSLNNRYQGRAAQMLGLLSVSSDVLRVTKSSEGTPEDIKKSNTSTPARRNLRSLYSTAGETSDRNELNGGDADENILKLKRALPTVTSSPSGPILKRKLGDVTDEATVSPATKRKRVSFDDPPTVSIYKYLKAFERSPQCSVKKGHKKQKQSDVNSLKRLDNAFNLDSVLSKTVESFDSISATEDTQNASLDITPAVEIVRTSELNDTDPIFPELVDCKDPIEDIALELSSPAMRDLLVKELEGKVETVGDLAKMTELDVNRLCIKAPKVKVAKEALSVYATKRSGMEYVEPVIEEAIGESESSKTATVEMQTDVLEVEDIEMQTVPQSVEAASTQTNSLPTAHTSAQTDESGSNTTSFVITSCINERPDFVRELGDKLNESSIQTIAEKLPTSSILELLTKKCDGSVSEVLDKVLEHQSDCFYGDERNMAELSFVRDHFSERYDKKDLVLFCSQLLHCVYEKHD